MNGKKIQRYLLACVLGLICFQSWSQEQEFDWEKLNANSNRLEGKLTGTIYYLPLDANSSHFLHEKWIKGSVLLEDGDVFHDVDLRYMAYGDELVIFNSNLGQLFIADKEKVRSFTAILPQGEQKFVKLNAPSLSAGGRYFELLYDGTRQLIAFHAIVNEKTSVFTDSYGKLRDSYLKPEISYFMYSGDSGFNKLQPYRKSFLVLFPERKRELRRLFRRNNLFRLNEKKMIQAFILMEEAGFF
jgi:hypothetical protein